MLIDLSLGLIIEPLNLSSHLSMEHLNFLHSPLGLLTTLGWSKEGCEVNGSTWIEPVNDLKWSETRGLAWCFIVCKLGMTRKLVLSFGAFIH